MSAGLEPSKFRPQLLLCEANQSLLLIHEMGVLPGNSCFHFVLLCLESRLHKFHFTLPWKNDFQKSFQSRSSRPHSASSHLFINKQNILREIGRDNENILIRKLLLLSGSNTRLLLYRAPSNSKYRRCALYSRGKK